MKIFDNDGKLLCEFEGDLSNADLSNADLSNADLKNADLSNADLSNADLSNAELSFADLPSGIKKEVQEDISNKINKQDIEHINCKMKCAKDIFCGFNIPNKDDAKEYMTLATDLVKQTEKELS